MKFEYRIIDYDAFSNDAPELLNEMGNNEWELVNFSNPIPYIGSDGFFIRYIFKRPIRKTGGLEL